MRTRNAILTLTFICVVLVVPRVAPAPIYARYPGVRYLAEHSDEIVVADLVSKLESENDFGFYMNFDVKIVRSLKGVLNPGQTIRSNIRFLGLMRFSSQGSVPDEVTSPTASSVDDRVSHLLFLGGGRQRTCSRYIIFLTDKPYVLCGPDKHPLNDNKWSNMNYEGCLIPFDCQLPFDAPPRSTDLEEVTDLINLEWERIASKDHVTTATRQSHKEPDS